MPSIVQLVKGLVTDSLRLARLEIDLVKARFAQSLRRAGLAIAVLLGAATLGLLGATGMLVAAGIALAIVLPAWGAALIVSSALLLLAAGAGLLGISQLRAATTPRTSGPVEIETELQETRYRLEAELEALSSRLDPRHRAHTEEAHAGSANGHAR